MASAKWTTCARALDWLDREFHLPLIFAGFSFGAAVGLRAACADDRVKAVDWPRRAGAAVSTIAAYDLDFLDSLPQAQAVRQRQPRPVRPASEAWKRW